jgi:chemotaxis protein histidine kinase CheA
VCELLFEPGMSTKNQVSEVSGRGVGLDAVKRTVEGLGGSIQAKAVPGKGMCFELDLPSMVALQRVLILWVHGHRVAVPVNRVDRVIDVKQGELERIGSEIFFMFEDEPIPLLDLGEHLGLGPLNTDSGGNIVLLEMREFRLGLLIDRAAADQEVFVREVPPVLGGRKELGGVAVLPDGTPVFLLEIGVLTERFN